MPKLLIELACLAILILGLFGMAMVAIWRLFHGTPVPGVIQEAGVIGGLLATTDLLKCEWVKIG